MTTKQKIEAERFVNSQASGVMLRHKLMLAVSFGFALRDQEVDEWKKLNGMQAADELNKKPHPEK